ncbi:GMC oxidoreductase family protein [Pleurotus pulmonarius]
MAPTLSLIPLLFLVAESVLARLFTDPSQLRSTTYDYVIVGAGTAGSVLANRLSEDRNVRVLVVEAGRSDNGTDVANIRIPFNAPIATPGTPFDWNYTTVNQVALNNQPEAYPRGKVLGGTSTTNYLVYTRGASNDYDRLATVADDEGWTWDNLHPYILKHSSFVASADGHNTSGQFDPAWHGNGPLRISAPGFPTVMDSRVMETTQIMSDEFPFNVDMNSGNPLGVGWTQSAIANGTRQSAATAYLGPVLFRSNLDVLINTQVTRLIQTGRVGGKPDFRSVEFAQSATSRRYRATARREVIVSAGAIGTPQVLLLSGIGDRGALSQLGIRTIIDNPYVGKDLQDHPFVPLQWEVNSNETFDQFSYSPEAAAAALNRWNYNHTGPFSTNPIANHLAFLRIPENNSIWEQFEDTSSGAHAPHYEIAFDNLYISTSTENRPTSGGFLSATTIVTSPTSRGYVKLNSSNPFDHPLIDPALLSTDYDMAVMVEAVRAVQRFVDATPWNGFIITPSIDSAQATTIDSIVEYNRQRGATCDHPTGTAQVGKVVNGDLTVKDVTGLRVVDASIFPYVPTAHTQAPVYIIAERAADLIKAVHRN